MAAPRLRQPSYDASSRRYDSCPLHPFTLLLREPGVSGRLPAAVGPFEVTGSSVPSKSSRRRNPGRPSATPMRRAALVLRARGAARRDRWLPCAGSVLRRGLASRWSLVSRGSRRRVKLRRLAPAPFNGGVDRRRPVAQGLAFTFLAGGVGCTPPPTAYLQMNAAQLS
jgi:hypothetical protein